MEQGNENIPKGILGAFLGSLIGVAIWIILGKLGFIGGIAGAVMIWGALAGYKKLGGAISPLGIIASIIIVVIMVYISTKLSWTIDVHSALKEYGYDTSFNECFSALSELLSELELKKYFIRDLVIGYVLTVVSGFSYIKKAL